MWPIIWINFEDEAKKKRVEGEVVVKKDFVAVF